MFQQLINARSLVDRQSRAGCYFVMMRYQQALVLPLLFALFSTACKRDAADGAPRITIIQPADHQQVQVPDTLLVQVEAHDDLGLEQVSVQLLNANDIPVVPAVSAGVGGTSASLTLELPIVQAQLPSGTYKLKATAYDGRNSGWDMRMIYVAAVPRYLRAVYALSVAPGQVAMHKRDSTGQVLPVATWPMDLGGAAVSSAAQRLVVAGGALGSLRALNPNGLGTAWQLPNQASIGAPWFTSVDLATDGRLYVGMDNGTLHAYDPLNGTGGTVAVLPDQFRAMQTVATDALMVTTERHFVTGEYRLGAYFRLSGAAFATQPLDLVPVHLAVRDEGHVLVFGNRNGTGRVLDRTLDGGGTWEAWNWPAPIAAVTGLQGGQWLVSLSNGDLYRFTYGGAGALPLGSTPVLHTLVYDDLNAVAYGGADNEVVVINVASGAVAGSWPVPGSVMRVLPLFNR